MSALDDSAPAFRVADMGQYGAYGMTLRDYFAAKAMQGADVDVLAAFAFKSADAMLAARATGAAP